jgi:hypothetical protein
VPAGLTEQQWAPLVASSAPPAVDLGGAAGRPDGRLQHSHHPAGGRGGMHRAASAAAFRLGLESDAEVRNGGAHACADREESGSVRCHQHSTVCCSLR